MCAFMRDRQTEGEGEGETEADLCVWRPEGSKPADTEVTGVRTVTAECRERTQARKSRSAPFHCVINLPEVAEP